MVNSFPQKNQRIFKKILTLASKIGRNYGVYSLDYKFLLLPLGKKSLSFLEELWGAQFSFEFF